MAKKQHAQPGKIKSFVDLSIGWTAVHGVPVPAPHADRIERIANLLRVYAPAHEGTRSSAARATRIAVQSVLSMLRGEGEV